MPWSSSAFIALSTLSLTATFGSCQISLVLTLPSTSILVKGGDYSSGIITCVATGATSLQLFRFDAQGSRNVVSTIVVPIPNGFVLTLSDSNVDVDAAGLYQCEAKDNSGNTERRNATIDVDVPPYTSGVFAHSNPSSGIVTEGTPFSINCSADASISPTPVIDLLHVMDSVSNTTGYELIYVVSSASKSDTGSYECFVENQQGNVTKSLPNSISVLVPANVDRFTTIANVPNNRLVEIEEGTDVQLECTASGDQPLTVKLLHNSQSLNESVSSTVRARLTSVKIGQDDGTYTCTAVNDVKTDEVNLTIAVYRKAFVRSFNNASQCVKSGAVVKLECVAEGLPMPDVRIIGPLGMTLRSAKGKASYSFNAAENTIGTYTCSARNKYNTENRKFTVRVARKPAAPTGLKVSDGASGANELKFMWTAPVFYCRTDFPIMIYRFFCNGGGSTLVVSAHFTEYAVPESRFRSGVHYNCSVIAENNIGQSSQSDSFLLRKPSGSPGTPAAVTTPRSVLVTWAAIPTEDRHGVIRKYTINVACVSALCRSQPSLSLSSTSLQRNIDGLSPNTEYRVQVSGHNVIGEGPQSSPFTFTTKPDKPSGPPQSFAIPRQLVHQTNFTVMWQKISLNQQNDAITSYTVYVECVTASSNCRTQTKSVDAPLLSVGITNLSPFTSYTVTVSGSNIKGEGPRSSSVRVTTAQGIPGPVQNLMATPFNARAVNVSWTEPSALNGELQRYDVTYSPSGTTIYAITPSIVIENLMDEKYTFEVRVVTGGGTSQQRTAEQRPVFPPTVSGPEKTIPLEFNSKRAILCDFRSYPFRVAKLMRSNEDLTSSANVSNRTEAPPHSQRLTYTVCTVGSYACAFASPADSATFEVTAPAEILNSTQSPATLNGLFISIFVEARQYPGIPEISCADLTGKVSILEYPDGANYRRATFTVLKARTVECSIVGTDKTVTIVIEGLGPIFGLPGWYDYLVVGIIFFVLLLLLFILLLLLIRWRRRGRMPSCCNFNSISSAQKVKKDAPRRRRIHLGVPIFEEILPKAPIYEEIHSTGGERQTSESRAYESFKEVAKQRPDEGSIVQPATSQYVPKRTRERLCPETVKRLIGEKIKKA